MQNRNHAFSENFQELLCSGVYWYKKLHLKATQKTLQVFQIEVVANYFLVFFWLIFFSLFVCFLSNHQWIIRERAVLRCPCSLLKEGPITGCFCITHFVSECFFGIVYHLRVLNNLMFIRRLMQFLKVIFPDQIWHTIDKICLILCH